MKPAGIVRKLDRLGRIVIPKELRRGFNLNLDENVVISSDGEYIMIKKVANQCQICGEKESIKNVVEDGKDPYYLCDRCIKSISKLI